MEDDPRDDDDVNALRRALIALLPGIGLAAPVAAQDAAATQARAYRVAFENDHVRALEYRNRPGLGVCGSGMHSHPAHLTVVLFDGPARVRTPDGAWKNITAKKGHVFWSEAETHEVENLSGRESHAILVELKKS
jgi:hypothetical protein